MAVLAEIVRSILIIIILTSFLELLLPDGTLRPFVRFAVGLFILIAVLNPVLTLLFGDHQFQLKLWDYRAETETTREIIDNGEKIEQQILNSNNETLKSKMQGQINAVTMLVPGVQEVASELQMSDDGSVEKLHIIIKPGEGKERISDEKVQVFSAKDLNLSPEEETDVKNKMVNIVKGLYGLEESDIKIEFEGG